MHVRILGWKKFKKNIPGWKNVLPQKDQQVSLNGIVLNSFQKDRYTPIYQKDAVVRNISNIFRQLKELTKQISKERERKNPINAQKIYDDYLRFKWDYYGCTIGLKTSNNTMTSKFANACEELIDYHRREEQTRDRRMTQHRKWRASVNRVKRGKLEKRVLKLIHELEAEESVAAAQPSAAKLTARQLKEEHKTKVEAFDIKTRSLRDNIETVRSEAMQIKTESLTCFQMMDMVGGIMDTLTSKVPVYDLMIQYIDDILYDEIFALITKQGKEETKSRKGQYKKEHTYELERKLEKLNRKLKNLWN